MLTTVRRGVRALTRVGISLAVPAIDRLFDIRYGTDTTGRHPGPETFWKGYLDYADDMHGYGYQGSPTSVFRHVIGSIPAELHRFTFVDFGSGKGRVLLLAAGFPFHSVVGVESVPALHDVALNNIAIFPLSGRLQGKVRSVLGDARTFAMPTGDLFLYFFNPFGAEILKTVLENLRDALQKPRACIIMLYAESGQAALIEASGLMRYGQAVPIPRRAGRRLYHGVRVYSNVELPGMALRPLKPLA